MQLTQAQPVETSAFEAVYYMDVKNDKNTINKKGTWDDIEGFALWYLNTAPVEGDFRTSFGFKGNYNGLGVYVFKHQEKWRILAIYNQGLDGLSVEQAVNNLSKSFPQ